MDSFNDVLSLKGLKLVHVNCRSILNKVNELSYIFDGVDILACSETWLNTAIPNNMIDIPAMDMFRFDRDNNVVADKTRGGGVSCYFRKDLKLNVFPQPEFSIVNSDIEILTLKCRYPFGKLIYVIVIYRPPKGCCNEFFETLSRYIETGNLSSKELYICGDFNIDFLQRNDIKTKSLITFLRTHGLKQHITTPTRITGFTKTCIDLIITNIPTSKIVDVGVLCDVISDHHPTFVCVKKTVN